ncbi:MAG TPA: histidine phosphatase family protein [Xanthomonadaceae bacterium]|jgi:broad specificity phosphatase PhoE|nr:histidine phosphatase family protein [Xanthomonadaceae bacterium]
MADIVLIRHGQASFGAADYDRLSAIGEEQSRRLGRWFRQTGQSPDAIATGSLRRHLRTAELCMEAAGLDATRIALAGLDEMDHEEVLARHRPDLAAPGALAAEMMHADDPHRAFQRLYLDAVTRWVCGKFDSDYTRSWNTFRTDVMQALQELAALDAGTVWVFTSGGPIAVIANALVGAPVEQTFALAWPLVNTSITRISADAKRSRLISYNGWPHLEAAGEADLITHR